ncbi:hypothetical protein [Rhodoligotrophos ferricapiens]|uniref:hypothetical protein n=1 Tax=Rhodoligotrophos ferricapiens TaxID=3069264 RepID=UPI00315CA2E1
MMTRVILSVGLLVLFAANGHAQDVKSMVKKACGTDYMRFCAAVPPTGDGMKALQCLIDHRKVVSRKCQGALLAAKESQEGARVQPGAAQKPRNNWTSQ